MAAHSKKMHFKYNQGYLSNRRSRRDLILAVILLAPTIYVLFRTFVYPIFQSFLWSFYKYNLLDGSAVRFIGFGNFINILQDSDFWTSIGYTVYFTVISTVIELVFGLFSALLLNQTFKGRTFFRVIIIIPWAMLTLVNGLLWKWIFQPNYGALSVILHTLHILGPDQNPLWMATPQSIVNSVIIADVWKMTPYITLLLLAGLQSISPTFYEAASIDGAGFWHKLLHVTLPHLRPMILIALTLRIIGAFRVYDILTIFTGDPTTSISYLTFNNAFRYFYMGRASAMAWLSTILILVLIVFYMIQLKKNEQN